MKFLKHLLLLLTLLLPIYANAAITPDATSANQFANATTLSYLFTTGAVPSGLLIVGVSTLTSSTPTVSYGGVPLTLVKTVGWNFGAGGIYIFGLLSPTPGTASVLITNATATQTASTAASYGGVVQSLSPDAFALTTSSQAGTAVTLSETTVADNCWTLMFVRGATGSTITAGSGTTKRTTDSGIVAILDSNGAISPPGSTSLTANVRASSTQLGAILLSFAPAPPPTPLASSPGFFLLMQ